MMGDYDDDSLYLKPEVSRWLDLARVLACGTCLVVWWHVPCTFFGTTLALIRAQRSSQSTYSFNV